MPARQGLRLITIRRSFYLTRSLGNILSKEDQHNLAGLARRLHKQNPSVYKHMKPPNIAKWNTSQESFIEDWNDIHDTAVTFGSPELVDQTSGAVYMRVAIHEDKCSKAYRVADMMPGLDAHDLCRCLELASTWPFETVMESETLTKIICSLDCACYQKITDENWALRAAFLVGLQARKKPSVMLNHVINHDLLWIVDKHPISYLLFAAFHNSPISGRITILNTTRLSQISLQLFVYESAGLGIKSKQTASLLNQKLSIVCFINIGRDRLADRTD